MVFGTPTTLTPAAASWVATPSVSSPPIATRASTPSPARLRRIRSTPHGKTAYLVALTGYGQPDDRRRAEAAGFDTHLVKPVDPDALVKMLARRG